MQNFVIRGDIAFAPAPDRLELCPDGFLVCEEGRCAGVFPELPERYAGLPLYDRRGMFVIPGYTDLHLHAPQYPNLGIGLDRGLLEWLRTLTYPTEARFSDMDFAEGAYRRFVRDLCRGFTTRAVVFATTHVPATLRLMELLEESGLICMAGKLSMDMNCPDGLREENAETALASVEQWLDACEGRFRRVKPILTPRFAPSCTAELLAGLGDIARRRGLFVQSHLGETRDEIAWVRELFPEAESYADVYARAGLLGPGCVMAHCIYLEESETELLRETQTMLAHCPTSNTNIRSGIAPVSQHLDAGLRVGLGSDVSGGHTLDMAEVLREALRVSGLRWRLLGDVRPLTPTEGFYLATKGGGAYFGKTGSFEPDYAFDALVVDAGAPEGRSLRDRFDRLIYLASAADVREKYVGGVRLTGGAQ